MSVELLDRIVVVLVRARNPNNIGAVARAMHDFGFRHLRVVSEYAPPLEAARSAIDASAVLADAKVFGTVAEAVTDCSLVVGTTAVGERALEHPLYALAEAAGKIHGDAGDRASRIALLFGSEKTGLSNQELSHCHWLLTIPMHSHEEMRHPSMNLGQAVAVCLYEIVRGAGAQAATGVREAARAGEVERFIELVQQVLEASEYIRRHPANSSEEQVRRLVLRMGLTAADVPIWMGILRQVLWRMGRQDSEETP
ncbi:RNA methyltransferase [Edaphobacter modestus]|uniref:tRNA (cytidine/uridine-2'-O-)-methyltransferase TrmJ n=1 Tax=Edaphobacter modestus TaxID=388466 RepID=A0A4Q7YWT2_9BACT|nr:TrmJ/YjtD family RNA methyltransferase [Edaphobacter modestus]RZU41545.1 tRNA/rRNA methyltransferase [Edaphobacter modestus]